MDVFLYRLCEVLLPNIVASWLSSGRLLIISVTVLCKDIYTVLKLKRAVLHPEKTQNRNQSSNMNSGMMMMMMMAPPLLLITVSVCF